MAGHDVDHGYAICLRKSLFLGESLLNLVRLSRRDRTWVENEDQKNISPNRGIRLE